MTASFFVHIVVIGLPCSFGVFQDEYTTNNSTFVGDHSELAVAFIGSVANSAVPFFAVMSGRLTDTFGHQVMCATGGVVLFISLGVASYATHYWHLLLTQGVIYGIACGLSYFPALTIISSYFDVNKGLATGLAVSGSGFGGLVMAPLVRYLLSEHGARWTLRFLSALSGATVLLCAVVLKPRLSPTTQKKSDFDYVTVLKDPRFMRLASLTTLVSFGYFIPFFFIPKFAVENAMSASEGALIVGLMQGASAVGRITLGFIADRVGHINTLWACITFAGVSVIAIWPFGTTFPILLLFGLAYGLPVGGFMSLLPTAIIEFFGTKDIATITGMVYTGFFIGALLGPPFAGFALDYFTKEDPETGLSTTNFLPLIGLSAGFILAGSVVLLVMKLILGKNHFFVRV